MEEIDYSAPYWFLVEVGHLAEGAEYTFHNLFRFQPKDRPLFSELVLFGSEEYAHEAAKMLSEKESRIRFGMKLEVHAIQNHKKLADLLENARDDGVQYVTISSAPGQPDHKIPIDLAIVGFTSI